MDNEVCNYTNLYDKLAFENTLLKDNVSLMENDIKDNHEALLNRLEQDKLQIYSDIDGRVSSLRQELEDRITASADDIFITADDKINRTKDFVLDKLNESIYSLKNEYELKHKDIYTHINQISSDLYSGIKESNAFIENTFSNKLKNVYGIADELKSLVDDTKEKLRYKAGGRELNEMKENLDNKIERISLKYEQILLSAKRELNESLAVQKAMCEAKLAGLESKLNDLENEMNERQKGSFARLMEKYGKSKRVG